MVKTYTTATCEICGEKYIFDSAEEAIGLATSCESKGMPKSLTLGDVFEIKGFKDKSPTRVFVNRLAEIVKKDHNSLHSIRFVSKKDTKVHDIEAYVSKEGKEMNWIQVYLNYPGKNYGFPLDYSKKLSDEEIINLLQKDLEFRECYGKFVNDFRKTRKKV